MKKKDAPNLNPKIQKDRYASFSQRVLRYQDELYQFFRYLGNSPSDSEDLVQETFVKLFQKLHLYEEQGNFRAFLYQMAKNLWIDQVKRKKRPLLMSLQNREASSSTMENPNSNLDLAMDIQWALGELEDKYRLPLVLKIYQNFKYKEVAEILDTPEGTVKTRVFQGIQTLRSILSAYQERAKK